MNVAAGAGAYDVVTASASVATFLVNPSAEIKARARKQLIESLAFIPDEVKDAFVEAMIKVPHLVELESNPDHHLEFTRYDPWKAAFRLANYWKTRLHIFGKERAFLPLTISTGHEGLDGAMSPEDIQVLNTGFFMVLPPQTNSSGRLVMFHDRSRLSSPELFDGQKRLRCLFYILSCMAESEATRRLGFDAIAVYTDKTRKQSMDRQLLADMASLVSNEILPIRQADSHVVLLSQRPLLRNAVPLTLHLLRKLKFLDRTKLHIHVNTEHRPEQILQELVEQHGYQAEGIPKSPLGGGFTVGCFRLWIEDRQRLELQRYAPYILMPNTATASAAEITPATTTAVLCETFQQQVKDDDDDEDEEKVRKRRETVAALARKRRARKQSTIKDIQDHVEFLRLQNRILHHANDTLESLMNQAQAIVNGISRDGDQKKAQTWKLDDPVAMTSIGHGDVASTTDPSSGQTRTISQEVEAASQSWLSPRLLHKFQEPQHFASRQPHFLAANVQNVNVHFPRTGKGDRLAHSSLDSMSDPSQILLPNPLLVQQPRISDQHYQRQQQHHHDLQQQQHTYNNTQWCEMAAGVGPWQVLPLADNCSHIRNDTTGENAADNPFANIPSLRLSPATSHTQQTTTTTTTTSKPLVIPNPNSSYIEETPPPTKNIPALHLPHREESLLLLEERQLPQAASVLTANAFLARRTSNFRLYHGHVLPNALNPMLASSLVDPNPVAFHDDNSVALFPSPHANNLNFSMDVTAAVDIPEPTPILVTGGNGLQPPPPPPPPASRNYFVDPLPILSTLEQEQEPNFPMQQQQQLLLHSHAQHSQPPSAEQDYPRQVSRGHGTLLSGAGGHETQEKQQGIQQEQHEQEEEEGFFHQLYEFLRKF